MTRLLTLSLAASVLALAGCKQEPDKPKTGEEVVAEAAKMTKPQPGLYKSTIKLDKLEIPGVPAKDVEQLKGLMTGSAQGREFCLTKAESEKGFEDFGKKLAQGQCTYDRFEASTGSLDAKLSCKTGQDMNSTIELKGTMSETSSQMTMKMHNSAPGMPGREMTMEAQVTSERIGDCPGGNS